MRRMNKKGFTLIELLAVIIILGLLMAIAIPSVTRYIDQSKRNTLVNTINNYISAAVIGMNNADYTFGNSTDGANVSQYLTNFVYAIPVGCVNLEKGGSNPFGQWTAGSYVLVTYHGDSGWRYGFQFATASNNMPATTSGNVKASAIAAGAGSLAAMPANGTGTGGVPATFNGATALARSATVTCSNLWRTP